MTGAAAAAAAAAAVSLAPDQRGFASSRETAEAGRTRGAGLEECAEEPKREPGGRRAGQQSICFQLDPRRDAWIPWFALGFFTPLSHVGREPGLIPWEINCLFSMENEWEIPAPIDLGYLSAKQGF